MPFPPQRPPILGGVGFLQFAQVAGTLRLVGLDEAYLVEQLEAFKSGARETQMMQMFAGQLSEQDMADLAAYYVTLSSE